MWTFEFLLSNADFMHFFNKLINSFSLVLDSAVFESISRFIKSIFDTFIPTAMCDADINPNKKEAKHADGVTFEDVFLFLWVMSVFMCLVRRDPDFDSGIDVTASSPTFSFSPSVSSAFSEFSNSLYYFGYPLLRPNNTYSFWRSNPDPTYSYASLSFWLSGTPCSALANDPSDPFIISSSATSTPAVLSWCDYGWSWCCWTYSWYPWLTGASSSSCSSGPDSSCDAPEFYQLGLQDPATTVLEGMISFHGFLLLILLTVGFVAFWLLFFAIKKYNSTTSFQSIKFTHSSILEIIWTIIPALILLIIASPSFVLLYSLDEYVDPALTLKVIGHQWYWSYEIKSHNLIFETMPHNYIEFDSYMLSTSDLTIGAFRLLEVDNRIILPVKSHIRLLVTAADVLHSWAIPSFGIKVDACPGRLSQASLFIKREGVFYGQCSEICGVNHGFMPIVVKAVTSDKYWMWLFHKTYTTTN